MPICVLASGQGISPVSARHASRQLAAGRNPDAIQGLGDLALANAGKTWVSIWPMPKRCA